MRSVIVTISGPARSGKDTLIDITAQALTRPETGRPYVNILSSIEQVKEFTELVAASCHYPPSEYQIGSPTQAQRQMWADIKAAIDRGLDYTARRPFVELEGFTSPMVLFYQVRELYNVQKIMARAEAMPEDERPAVISVFVRRTEHEHVSARIEQNRNRATTDQYTDGDAVSLDILVNNTSLQALQSWGDFLALRIAATINS